MAQIVHGKLAAEGIHLHLGDGVSSFETTDDDVTTHLASGASVTAGLVVLAIGVRPNGELARAAGLAVNERGGIKVDDLLRTSDPDIYAVGDVIEVTDLVSEEPTMVPLAGPANRQGRMAADNICGADKRYRGTQGTSIAKAFDLAIATTGASEKTLVRRRLQRGRDFESVTIVQNSHESFVHVEQAAVRAGHSLGAVVPSIVPADRIFDPRGHFYLLKMYVMYDTFLRIISVVPCLGSVKRVYMACLLGYPLRRRINADEGVPLSSRIYFSTDARYISPTDSASVRSNSSFPCWAVRPCSRAREKLAMRPGFLARRASASSLL